MSVLTVIAGPNGSGKSTLTRSIGFEGHEHLLDPDAVAKDINPSNPSAAAIAAAREVPDMDVRRRYTRSLGNLAEAIRLSDIAEVYDNSGDEHQVILTAKSGLVVWRTKHLPQWAEFLSILESR